MNKIKQLIGMALILIIGILSIMIIIKNPDMTETRLLITYWKEYCCMVVIGLIGYFLVKN